jgi:hypothetical protein
MREACDMTMTPTGGRGRSAMGNGLFALLRGESTPRRAASGVDAVSDLAIPVAGTSTLKLGAPLSDVERRVLTTEIPVR